LEKTVESISKWHKRRFWENLSCKWVNVAYHYLVWKDWTIVQTRCLDELGWHNSKNNANSIGISLIWNFNENKPTQEQYEALGLLLDVLKELFTGAVVKPHRAWGSNCPWKYFDQTQIWIQAKTNKIGEYILSRYYSPEPNQTEYFKGSYLADVKMNCWLNKDWTAWDCSHTANWYKLKEWEEWLVGACPQWLKWKHIQIDMGFGKQDFYCADVGSAIIGNRLDIWCWFWETWYNWIKNWTCKNTGTAKIYLSK